MNTPPVDNTGVVIKSGPANATLTTGNATSTTFAVVFQDGAATPSLTKNGTGTLMLTGTSTYTGATTVIVGTLEVNGSISYAAMHRAARPRDVERLTAIVALDDRDHLRRHGPLLAVSSRR